LAELSQPRAPAARSASPAQTRRQSPRAHTIRVTAVSRALQLLLHSPALAQQVDDPAALRTSTVRGADFVADAVEFCRNDPNIPLARWLEHYRDNPAFNRLQTMATTPPPGDDAEQHRLAFQDSIRQLLQSDQRDHLRKRYNALLECQASRQLDDDEARELR